MIFRLIGARKQRNSIVADPLAAKNLPSSSTSRHRKSWILPASRRSSAVAVHRILTTPPLTLAQAARPQPSDEHQDFLEV
jgi:hypothetical protein